MRTSIAGRGIGIFLLALYLIVVGVQSLGTLAVGLPSLAGLLALLAGIFLLIGR